ncbi:NUDIX domain-containing protein [Mucilaginibacter sp. AW1-3]
MLIKPKYPYFAAMQHPEDNPWKITSQKEIYSNPWIHLTEYQVINPSGKPGIYGKVHFKNLALGVIALDDNHNTYLVGQYRFTIDQYSWEMPEGGGPIGIEPIESIKRELLEETGLKASRWTELQRIHLSNSVSDELGICYLAQGLEQFEAQPEETEQLMVRKLPFEDVYQMVTRGQITDSLTVASVLRVKLMMIENLLP